MEKLILRMLSALIVAVGFGSLASSDAAATPPDSVSANEPAVIAQADIDHDDGDVNNENGDVGNVDEGDIDNVDDGDVGNVDDADVDNIDNGDANIDNGNN